MSEKELNSYRFTSGADPTDEMLSTIMKEVAQEAKEKKEMSYTTNGEYPIGSVK